MHPVPGWVVIERQQLVKVAADLRGGLGELRSVGSLERLRRGEGVLLVFGGPDLRQGLLRPGWADLGRAARTFAALCCLCRRRHKFHYADLGIMPIWDGEPLVAAA